MINCPTICGVPVDNPYINRDVKIKTAVSINVTVWELVKSFIKSSKIEKPVLQIKMMHISCRPIEKSILR